MSDDVTFQTSVTATPPNATRIATDNISGAHHQFVKVEFGDNGTAYALAYGTPMPIGTLPGTAQVLGTFQPLAGSVHLASGTVTVLGTIQAHGTTQALGTFQAYGTAQTLGTYQPLAGSVHLANAIPAGNNNIGDVDVISMPTVTVQATNLDIRDLTSASDSVASVQSGAWSVDVASLPNEGQQTMANSISVAIASNQSAVAVIGTFQAHGTVPIGTVAGTVQVLGTVQAHGTTQALGTFQPLAGSVHIANSLVVTIGTISGGTIQAFGTTEILGTVRALTTVNAVIGTIQEGTINSFTGTAQVLGSVQGVGTFQVLGTVQTVAGMLFGSVQGWQANGGAVAGNPVLLGGFGSSGTQAAVDDGDAVRAWFDLNGRLQVRGTIDSIPSITIGAALPAGNNNIGDVDVASMPTVTVQATNLDIRDLSSASDSVAVVGTVQTHGTSQALGTVQPLAGSVHVANVAAVLGTTSFVTGGTAHIGSVQRITGGTIDFLGGTVAVGTVRQVLGTVLMRPYQAGEGFLSTVFTGAGATNGTLVPAPASGTYTRVWDVVVSGSAAGSAFLELGNGTIFGPVFTAVNGGWSFNSAKGVRTNGTAQDILFNYSAGSWGVTVNYSLEIL